MLETLFRLPNHLYIKLTEDKVSKDTLSSFGILILTILFFIYSINLQNVFNALPVIGKLGLFLWDGLWGLGFILMFAPLLKNHHNNKFSVIALLYIIFLIIFGLSFITSTIGRIKLATLGLVVYLPISLCIDIDNFVEFKKIIFRLMEYFIYGAVFYYICSLILSPYFGHQYIGLSHNTNSLAQYSIVIFVLALILAQVRENKVFYTIISVVSLGFVLISQSRTSLLTVVSVLFVYFIYLILIKKINSQLVKYVTVIAISILLFFTAFTIQSKIYSQYSDPYLIEYFKKPNLKNSTNETQFSDEIDLTSRLELDGEDYEYIVTEEDQYVPGPIYKFIDRITTHRLSIWRVFLRNTKFMGQPVKLFDVPGYYVQAKTAHNNFIQASYDAGWIAGISYLVLSVLALFKSLLHMLKSKFGLFVLLISIVYLGIGFFSSLTYMNLHITAFFYFISLMPYMTRSKKEEFNE